MPVAPPRIKPVDEMDAYSYVINALYRLTDQIDKLNGHLDLIATTLKEIQAQGNRRPH